MIFIDRSRVSLDHKCQRARFWGNEFRGRGIAPEGAAYPLIFGSVLHEALAHVNRGESAEAALALVQEEFTTRVSPLTGERGWYLAEQWALLSGLVHGYTGLILPQILGEYEIFSVEGECEMPLKEGIVLVATPDMLVRRKADRTLWYLEFKSTSSNSGKWVKSWGRSIQAMAGALTMEQSVGEELAGYTILGLYKGYKDKKDGRTRSPLTYWWKRGDEESPDYKKGWEMLPTWEREGGVAKVVADLLSTPEGMQTVADLFPQTQPLFVNRRLVDQWIAQLIMREEEISAARQPDFAFPPREVMDRTFSQNFDNCEPSFGFDCPFVNVCFNPAGEADPFSQGYKWRDPHHKGDPAIGLHTDG